MSRTNDVPVAAAATNRGRIVAIVQARTGSSRLPGKVLLPLGGGTMMGQVLRRARRIPGIDAVVLATTTLPADDLLERVARDEAGVATFRGPEDDVLARYAGAARQHAADVVVRITADCPLLSPAVSGRVIRAYLDGPRCDYCSNTLERTFPRGLDTEVFSREALERADAEATTPAEREHVTPFLWRQPDRFRLRSVRDDVDRSHLRWTVDVAEDLSLVRAIYSHPDRSAGLFEYDDVLRALHDHPEWVALNQHVEQKEVPP